MTSTLDLEGTLRMKKSIEKYENVDRGFVARMKESNITGECNLVNKHHSFSYFWYWNSNFKCYYAINTAGSPFRTCKQAHAYVQEQKNNVNNWNVKSMAHQTKIQ